MSEHLPLPEDVPLAWKKYVVAETESAEEQIGRLATLIMEECPHEIREGEGVVDCAFRLIATQILHIDLAQCKLYQGHTKEGFADA